MYQFYPVTPRVERLRERYRNTLPRFDSELTRIVTEYYQTHEAEPGILKRAGLFLEIARRRTLVVSDGELLCYNLSTTYRGSSLNPEYGIDWLIDELQSGAYDKRTPLEEWNQIDPEDREYLFSIADYWKRNSMKARVMAVAPEGIEQLMGEGVIPFRGDAGPIGHFCANYRKVVEYGFGAIKRDCQTWMDSVKGNLMGHDAERYTFYRALIRICDAAILMSKRYAEECRRQAEAKAADDPRKTELLQMAEGLDHIMEHPARTFWEAVQAILLYQLMLSLDGLMHGLTVGRFDQYVYPYYKRDIEEGRLTREQAQEILDCFFLKIAEGVNLKPTRSAQSSGGYTSGQHMSLGGVKKDGSDATNDISFMMLESMARLKLHDPPLSLRVHKNSPRELLEAAVACTREVGGIPTLQNDEVIIPTLLERGFTLEDARDYCLIGCVEPAGCGNDWPMCGGTGRETYLNLFNILLIALNNGINPMTGKQLGLPTGYLYEMDSFQQVKDAYAKQCAYFVRWHATTVNLFEMVSREYMPLPVVSVTMDGCFESGKDVLSGGAKYNSTGSSGVGCANLGDSLTAIQYLCFDKKRCTTRTLYDAMMADWEGYEDIHRLCIDEVPHYGNDIDYADENCAWAMEVFAREFLKCTGPRGNPFEAGLYPVSTHISHGRRCIASPDGRKKGEPLADGVSPRQQMDKNGPTAILHSVAKLPHALYRNGTLLNMKFSPKTIEGDEGTDKLISLFQIYFALGGMHVQYNVISSETLRDAQKRPEEYQNLVIRIAGFSAYFVDLYPDLQNDLIRRTEIEC